MQTRCLSHRTLVWLCLGIWRLAGRRGALAAFAAGALAAAPATASIYTVGAGAGCTHADLLSALIDAVNHAGTDEIRLLANTSHQGPFFVNTDGLFLRGGFASCAAATPTGFSTLLGTNSSRALFLNAAGPVYLERLNISGGHVAGNGGGVFVQGASDFVVFSSVAVFGNSATGFGGNIYVSSVAGAVLTIADGSLVTSGQAQDGGGLACAGAGKVSLKTGSLIANNVAVEDGGGLHLTSGCTFEHSATGNFSGIVSNQAGGYGGGAFVDSGADLVTGYWPGGLAEISNNTAHWFGGGVYLRGAGSVLQAYFARISGNHSDTGGGGVAADTGTFAVFGRPSTDPDVCADPSRCSLVQGNSAGFGGGIYSLGATVTAHGTRFENNTATSGGAIGAFESQSSVALSSSIFAGNSGPKPIDVGTGTTLVLGNVTVVGNTGAGAGFISFGAGPGDVRVLSSLFDQPDSQIFTGFSSQLVQLDCVLSRTVNFLSGLPAGTVTRAIVIADPRLRNPAAGDYRLSETSPAIDRCDTTQWLGAPNDLEWQPRDIDHAIPNGLGIRDLGADEASILRRDGFESGGTGVWRVPEAP